MRALASLLNRGLLPPGVLAGLALVDLDRRTAVSVDVEHPALRAHWGGAGLARIAGGYVLALQSRPVQFVVLDRDLAIVDVFDAPRAVDPHGLAVVAGLWFVASTADDAVLVVDPDRGTSEVVWRLPSGGADTVHLNSIFARGDSLGATAFGWHGGRRVTARLGLAFDLFSGAVLISPIRQPHSGRDEDGRTMACESSRGRIVSDGLGTLEVPLGYVRGLDATPDHLLVGTSRGRRPPIGRSTVQLFERRGTALGSCVPAGRVDLSALGPEVYDVLLID